MAHGPRDVFARFGDRSKEGASMRHLANLALQFATGRRFQAFLDFEIYLNGRLEEFLNCPMKLLRMVC